MHACNACVRQWTHQNEQNVWTDEHKIETWTNWRDKRQGGRKRGRGMAGARGIFASRRPWRVSGPAEADSGATGLGSTANSYRLQCKQRRQA